MTQVPIADQTSWELVSALDAAGWTWKRTPPKTKPVLDYRIGEPQLWYTSGPTASAFYLRCLLSAPHLLELGFESIPHAKPRSYYKSMLAGKKPVARRHRLALMLESDVADIPALPGLPAPRRRRLKPAGLLLALAAPEAAPPLPPPPPESEEAEEEEGEKEEEPAAESDPDDEVQSSRACALAISKQS